MKCAVGRKANVLAFSAMPADWFVSSGAVEHPPIVDWRVEHPLLRHVSFDNVHVGRSIQVTTPPWAVAVVESPQAPLIIAGDRGRYGEVHATTLRAANLEVWRWFLALGLSVLLIEWWYYHRRTA